MHDVKASPPKEVGLRFGVSAPKIKDQLEEQGLRLDEGDAQASQEDADAVIRLHIRDYLTDSMANKARDRLMKWIASKVRPLNTGATGKDA